MRRLVLAAIVAAIPWAAAPAGAHVAPSEDTNNRYVKLTPMADRVRVAYTILVGQRPGRAARAALDRDRDRTLSDAEVQAWADDLAAQVRRSLELRVDGAPAPVTWSEVHAGVDERAVDAGAFSLDLITWVCAPGAGPRHEVELIDRFSLLPPGETEVRIADEPGIRVEVARVGAHEMIGRHVQFQALAAPLAEGVRVVYDASRARPLADGRCPRPKPTTATSRWPFILAALGALAAAVLWIRHRARRRTV